MRLTSLIAALVVVGGAGPSTAYAWTLADDGRGLTPVRLRGRPVRGRRSTAASTSAGEAGESVLAPGGRDASRSPGSVPGGGRDRHASDGRRLLGHAPPARRRSRSSAATTWRRAAPVGAVGSSSDDGMAAPVRPPRRSRDGGSARLRGPADAAPEPAADGRRRRAARSDGCSRSRRAAGVAHDRGSARAGRARVRRRRLRRRARTPVAPRRLRRRPSGRRCAPPPASEPLRSPPPPPRATPPAGHRAASGPAAAPTRAATAPPRRRRRPRPRRRRSTGCRARPVPRRRERCEVVRRTHRPRAEPTRGRRRRRGAPAPPEGVAG